MDREVWGAVIHGGCKELDTTERLNWTELNIISELFLQEEHFSILPLYPILSFSASGSY